MKKTLILACLALLGSAACGGLTFTAGELAALEDGAAGGDAGDPAIDAAPAPADDAPVDPSLEAGDAARDVRGHLMTPDAGRDAPELGDADAAPDVLPPPDAAPPPPDAPPPPPDAPPPPVDAGHEAASCTPAGCPSCPPTTSLPCCKSSGACGCQLVGFSVCQ